MRKSAGIFLFHLYGACSWPRLILVFPTRNILPRDFDIPWASQDTMWGYRYMDLRNRVPNQFFATFAAESYPFAYLRPIIPPSYSFITSRLHERTFKTQDFPLSSSLLQAAFALSCLHTFTSLHRALHS